MAFLNPVAFYLLGTIPIVIALHFLKLRRQRYVVPSILLWRTSAEAQKANIPFQRLRNLLLPILQTVFLLLVIVSVARPALHRTGTALGKTVIVVDNSASMQASALGKTRLELAKAEAKKHARSRNTMVMTTHASQGTYIQQAFTTDEEKLQHAIENIRQTHIATNPRPALDAAVRYIDSPQDDVLFISDTFENLPDTPDLPINKIPIGGTAENVGIVQFSVERVANTYTVFAAVQNWTDTAKTVDIRLEAEGKVGFDDKVLKLPARKRDSVRFMTTAEGLEGVVISLHLDIDDDFELDNQAWARLQTVKPLQILLVSDRRQPILQHLLQSYGDRVELQLISSDEYHGTGDADITVFDIGTTPKRDAFGTSQMQNLMFINPRDELLFMQETPIQTTQTPVTIIAENRTHPLMQDVSLIGLQVAESVHRDLPSWGHSLVETEKGSLIWLGIETGRQMLVFEFDAFNPKICDLVKTIPEGPLFIYRCLEWFEAGTARIKRLVFQGGRTQNAFRTGEHLSIEVPADEKSDIQVQKPDKTLVGTDGAVFTETDQIGVYTVFVGGTPLERFTVNLLDATESALLPPATEVQSQPRRNETALIQPIRQEVWRWTALLALCLLTVEWWFYHRTS